MANIKFLTLIRTLLEKGRVLSLDDAQKARMDILHYHRCDSSPSRKYLTELIVTNIDSIVFVCAFRRISRQIDCLTAAKVPTIDSAVTNLSNSDLRAVFHCSKILCKGILQTGSRQFDGTLNADTSEMILTKLLILLQWTPLGVATELQTEKHTDEVNTKAVLLA